LHDGGRPLVYDRPTNCGAGPLHVISGRSLTSDGDEFLTSGGGAATTTTAAAAIAGSTAGRSVYNCTPAGRP